MLNMYIMPIYNMYKQALIKFLEIILKNSLAKTMLHVRNFVERQPNSMTL